MAQRTNRVSYEPMALAGLVCAARFLSLKAKRLAARLRLEIAHHLGVAAACPVLDGL